MDDVSVSDLVEKAETEYHKARADAEEAEADRKKAKDRVRKYEHVLAFLREQVGDPTTEEGGDG